MSLSPIRDRTFCCNRCRYRWIDIRDNGRCAGCGDDDYTEEGLSPLEIAGLPITLNDVAELVRDLEAVLGFALEGLAGLRIAATPKPHNRTDDYHVVRLNRAVRDRDRAKATLARIKAKLNPEHAEEQG